MPDGVFFAVDRKMGAQVEIRRSHETVTSPSGSTCEGNTRFTVIHGGRHDINGKLASPVHGHPGRFEILTGTEKITVESDDPLAQPPY